MIRLVIWVVIIVLALSFFGISLQGLWEDPTTQANFDFILDLVRSGWDLIVDWFVSLRDALQDIITGEWIRNR